PDLEVRGRAQRDPQLREKVDRRGHRNTSRAGAQPAPGLTRTTRTGALLRPRPLAKCPRRGYVRCTLRERAGLRSLDRLALVALDSPDPLDFSTDAPPEDTQQAQPRQRPPQGAADEPVQGAHRARADQDDRSEGEGRQTRGREADHAREAR